MSKKLYLNQRVAAANIAYAFSDVIEFSSGNFMQAKNELLNKIDCNDINLFGQTTRIIDYTCKDDELAVAFGAAKGGALVSIFIEDTGVTCLSRLVKKFYCNEYPAVFYVETDDTNVCKYNLPDGVGVVFPATAQEVIDFSILAHLSVGKSYKPFIVCLNKKAGFEPEEVDFPGYEDINRLFDVVALNGTRARALKRGMSCAIEVPILIDAELPEIVDYYLDMIKKELGREYKLIDYIGCNEAEKVLVSTGSETPVIEETVKKLTAAGNKVGLVKINVIAPFKKDLFKEVFPSTCKKAVLVGCDCEFSKDKSSLFNTMRELAGDVDWRLDSYFIGMNDCKKGLVEKAFAAMDNDQKPEGKSDYFKTSMDGLYYHYDIKDILDMGDERLVIANSAGVNNIDYGVGICIALEQRRAWIMNEVLFLADNTKYPSVAKNSYAYLEVKDDPKKSYHAGQVMLDDEVRDCFACSTCTNIAVAEELLTKKYIWIFGGDARDASLDPDAIRRALATGTNINIIVIENKALYKKAAAKTGKDDIIFMANSMNNVFFKAICADMEKDKIEAILRQAELYDGPSFVVYYV